MSDEMLFKKIAPRDAIFSNQNGINLLKERRYKDALLYFDDAIKLSNGNIATYYYNKGLALFELRMYEATIDVCKHALNIKPNTNKYFKLINDARYELKEQRQYLYVDTQENSVGRQQTKSIYDYLNEGKALFNDSKYYEALQAYEQGLKINPDEANIWVGKGDAFVALSQYEKALQAYQNALQKLSIMAVYKGKGQALIGLKRLHEALEVYDQALKVNPRLVDAYEKKGQILLEYKRFPEAVKAYDAAIECGTTDIECYINAGNIFTNTSQYNQALSHYTKALQLNPNHPSVHLGLGQAFFGLAQHKEAITSLTIAIELNVQEKSTAFLRLGDSLTILGEQIKALHAYTECLTLACSKTPLSINWHLANIVQSPSRPIDIQLKLYLYFLTRVYTDAQANIIFHYISTHYDKLFNTETVDQNSFNTNSQILCSLLNCVPEADREQALCLCIQNNSQTIAKFLIYIAPSIPSGLKSLVIKVIENWDHSIQQNELVAQLCKVLRGYEASQETIDFFLVKYFVTQKQFEQAETLLSILIEKTQANPEIFWLLTLCLRNLEKSPQYEVELLERFITLVPIDARVATAYQRIGNLYGSLLRDGDKAIAAYKEAEQRGCNVPQLQAFRLGNWDEIPALRTHADYSYPPIIVIDLENDYLPEATPGTRVVEVGAVRAKGCTELNTYEAVIKRDFIAAKVSQQQDKAKAPERVVQELEIFFAETHGDFPLLVGHNIRAFDALQLRGMGISIHDDQLIDTLTFARHLYPDSLHHNLELLCHIHDISFNGKAHNALPDARACLYLLHALGNELVQRGNTLIAGFRAFTTPDCAFDKAVLQPRNIVADSTYKWELNPNPTSSYVLALNKNSNPSPSIVNALETKTDVLIERYDPSGSYIRHVPNTQQSVITVSTRTRLERIFVARQELSDVFVLPDPHTLLCPHLLRRQIEQADDNQIKLLLFCLYQASHNHDASTLYPLRLPTENLEIVKGLELSTLRKLLLKSCCKSDFQHFIECPAAIAVRSATQRYHILLATHEVFIRQQQQIQADTIIVDDVDELQMRFAQYMAERITSKQLEHRTFNDNEKEALAHLKTQMDIYVGNVMSNVGSHERINLQTFASYLRDTQDGYEQSILSLLQASGPNGNRIAHILEDFCQQASQKARNPTDVHVYWLDLLFSHGTDESINIIEQWEFYGLSRNLQQAFRELFWHPYKQRILCGTAINLGNLGTTFIKNYFGLPENVLFCSDERPHSQIYIPSSKEIRPASFLVQYSWAMSIGQFIYSLTKSEYSSILVTMHTAAIADVLTNALKEHTSTDTQVLSPTLGWTISKIAERITRVNYKTLTIISPRTRQLHLQEPVDVEITGPMRFMNQRDPLVAAQMLAHVHGNKDNVNEGVFTTYLLPQALLELKARVLSPANLHIILDSSLRESFYRDEVRALFKQNEILDTLPDMSLDKSNVPEPFVNSLSSELQKLGFNSNTTITEEELLLALKTLWHTESFRKSPHQKEVVQNVLANKDQLVIAPTGGGKSLCFQLPAILMAQDMTPKVTIIFSPLIALMKDQVQALHDKGIFSAMYFDNSQQDYLRGIKRGDYSIIYVAPEKIHNAAFRKAIQYRDIGFIAFDEAHCVSQWGHDFRTDYFAVKPWIDEHLLQHRVREFPLLALTATARKSYNDENSTVGDIIKKLGLLNLTQKQVVVPSLERKELRFQVEHIELPYTECPHTKEKKGNGNTSYCEDCRNDTFHAKLEKLKMLLTDTQESGLHRRWDKPYGQRQRGLIYCARRRTTETITQELSKHPQLKRLRIGMYHAGMEDKHKHKTYEQFIDNEANGLDIIIATNAFGMGIDVRRLGFVIHFDTPGTPEAYYQEAGRAGRDQEFQEGKDYAQCILLYHESDLSNHRHLSNKKNINKGDIQTVYTSLREWCTTHCTDEAIITKPELAVISNVDEEKIDVIIHYLEHNTYFREKPVIKREENVQRVLQLKFVQGHKTKALFGANNPTIDALLHIFESQDEWCLNEQSVRDIDLYNLLAHFNEFTNLRWNINDLYSEIFGLIASGILAHKSKGHILWKCRKDDALKSLNDVEQEIHDVFKNMSKVDRDKFENAREIIMDITKWHSQYQIDTPIKLTSLGQFLFALSRENVEELRLFENFKRYTRIPNYKQYKVKRWKRQTKSTQEVLAEIFRQLQQVIQRFAPEVLQVNELVKFDLLEVTNSKEELTLLSQRLYWLDILSIVSYTREFSTEATLRIKLLQKNLTASDLYIDMKEHTQAKTNAERKLLLMKEYAMLPSTQRAGLFEKYFRGEIELT